MTPKLIGEYLPPRVRRGQKVFCLYRDADCKITTWHGGRISWPRCNQVGQMGGSGLWVNDTLRRAIETESAAALMYWFGVGGWAVWKWRKAFGITHTGTEGSRAAHLAPSQSGANALKLKEWTNEEMDARSERSKRHCPPLERWAEAGWKLEELVLLGTMPDQQLAAKIGRTRSAVRAMRWRKKVPAFVPP